MDDQHEDQSQFIHAFSSPLTALQGAVELLRHPRRLPDDPVTRDLIETLERSAARLRGVVDTLIAHSRVHDGVAEVVVPLSALGLAPARTPEPPAADRTAPAAARQPPTIPAATGAPTAVLCIGAVQFCQETCEAALPAAGYQVRAANDGPSGIDLAREIHPDLIVLDFELPPPGAQQVAQVLREDPETKTIPMIYVAGSAQPPIDLPSHVEWIVKGAAPGALRALAEQLVGAARAEEAPTLLIVDDDADIQRILSLRLRQDGYRIVQAATGAEALIAAQKQPFDLIILDLLLPDIDGFSVLGALRARKSTAMTPIILLSARDSAQEKVRGLQIGADDYVTKPFSAAELLARVRAALRRHEHAAGANPSTGLPGNIAIERAIRSRIENNLPFAVCYVDIDNFKAYNDTYSFLKGDAVIHQTAHILLAAVEQRGNSDDFVGHIGGDDFIVITTPDRAEPISAHVIASFDQLAPLFYDADARELGFIDAVDRQGRPARYPLVGLSIAIISSARHPIQHLAEVAQRAVDVKKRAKEQPGSVYVLED
jgi:DNA-binding response OmpR family regulator